jgi:hypothetical protein
MRYIFLFLLIMKITVSKAQFIEPKFGKIDMSELSMTRYEKDTTAGALMLFDNGILNFIIGTEGDFQQVFERHCRIKFFNKSEFHLADFIIRLKENGGDKEVLSELKAVTYNLVEGKIIKTKLNDKNIFTEKTENILIEKIAFPEVKEGSVIELSYKITSDFLFSLKGWTFQYSIPAIWSQYIFTIPEYYNYRKTTRGYLSFDVNKNQGRIANFYYQIENQISPGIAGSRPSVDVKAINTNTTETTLAVKEVPAFIPEPDIDCDDNYLQSIEFELSSKQFPDQMPILFTQTWESVNKLLNDHEDFGKLLKSNGFIEDTVAKICTNKATENEKAVAIYDYVQRRMKWNEDYHILASNGLKKPFINRSGSSSEINLLLTLMLQTAGLKADPVMFSTRDNGFTDTLYPTITKYNSVLTRVEIEGKEFLLDATDKYCPFGVLTPNDVNGKGRVVNKSTGEWTDLNVKEKYKETKSYVLKLNAEGKFIGTITELFDGYGAIALRNGLSNAKNYDDYFRIIQENLKGLTITKYSISDIPDNYKPVTDTLHVEITDHAEVVDDKILFNPLLFERIEKNRYTLEERKYPVDYNFPISEMYVFEYTIPDGYEVESLPQSIILKLPDNSLTISYAIQKNGNKITMAYKRNVKKILFLPDEYKDLKEMYDQMVKVHSGMVILKKIGGK